MKLALYQGPSPAGDIARAFGVIETVLRRSADYGATMVVFPELFLPGYNVGMLHHEVAQPFDGDWMKKLSNLARVSGCGLVVGFPERDGMSVYNSAVAIDAQGALLARYRKIQLYGNKENALFASGESYTTFDWQGRRVALLICYDVEFPEHVRALRRLGVELILVPTANMAPFSYVSKTLVPARAHENNVAIAYANYCGSEKDLDYVGLSVLVAADGRPIELASETEESLMVSDFDALRGDGKMHGTQLEDLRTIRSPLKLVAQI